MISNYTKYFEINYAHGNTTMIDRCNREQNTLNYIILGKQCSSINDIHGNELHLEMNEPNITDIWVNDPNESCAETFRIHKADWRSCAKKFTQCLISWLWNRKANHVRLIGIPSLASAGFRGAYSALCCSANRPETEPERNPTNWVGLATLPGFWFVRTQCEHVDNGGLSRGPAKNTNTAGYDIRALYDLICC